MERPVEEQLKEYILSQYGNVKAFSTEAGIPNSTINTIFRRGILNSTVGSVILIANALNISVDALVEGKISPKISTSKLEKDSGDIENLKKIYANLNQEGRHQLMLQADLVAGKKEFAVSPPRSKTG